MRYGCVISVDGYIFEFFAFFYSGEVYIKEISISQGQICNTHHTYLHYKFIDNSQAVTLRVDTLRRFKFVQKRQEARKTRMYVVFLQNYCTDNLSPTSIRYQVA